jgi:rhodanese-related sulfurtransferase
MQNSTGRNDYVAVDALERLLANRGAVTLLDARSPEEYSRGHVPGAINVPIADLLDFARDRLTPSRGPIVTMCGSSGRGEQAAEILTAAGVENVRVLQGGLKAWSEAGFAVVD